MTKFILSLIVLAGLSTVAVAEETTVVTTDNTAVAEEAVKEALEVAPEAATEKK